MYKINNQVFNTLKEALQYQNIIENQNKKNMFDKSKQIDATITKTS